MKFRARGIPRLVLGTKHAIRRFEHGRSPADRKFTLLCPVGGEPFSFRLMAKSPCDEESEDAESCKVSNAINLANEDTDRKAV